MDLIPPSDVRAKNVSVEWPILLQSAKGGIIGPVTEIPQPSAPEQNVPTGVDTASHNPLPVEEPAAQAPSGAPSPGEQDEMTPGAPPPPPTHSNNESRPSSPMAHPVRLPSVVF